MDALEQRTMSKVAWRLVPFLMLCYFWTASMSASPHCR
jgi:hypothetical protein